MRKVLSFFVVLLVSLVATTAMAQSELTRYPVYTMGENNSQYYRIPALVETANGTLVAIADQRGADLGDLPNIISIVAKTSTDGGKNWSSMKTIAQGSSSAGTTYGDAAAVYDEETGKIITVFVGNQNYGSNCVGLWASNSSYPLRLYKSESSDNGATWTTPVDISNDIYNGIYGSRSYWIGMFAGSGSAVQLKKGDKAGRLMFVVAARNNSTWGGTMSNYAVYSDDHGATWKVSNNAACANGDEAKIVELSNGDLLMSIKNRNKGYRLMAKSTDQGVNWTTAEENTTLMDPACNGDVVSYTTADGKYYLLHSMPGSSSNRENVTVYLSADGGDTWPIKRQIYSGYSAYSALEVLNDGTIGIVIEEGKWDAGLPGSDGFNLAYYNFTLDWLLNGQEPEIPLAEGVLDLNGSRYMSIPNDAAFNIAGGGSFTVTCKVKLPQFKSGANMRFVNNRAYEGTSNSGTTGFDIFGGNSSSQAVSVNLSYDGKPWGNSFAWNTGLTQDTWAHITWVLDGTTTYLYVDGVKKETKTGMSTNGMPSKADILVGAGYTNTDGSAVQPAYFTTGYIDDVRFYNKALSAAEVAADMTSTVDSSTANLVAAYDFNNIQGYDVEDISGNGHTGTLVGFPEEVQYTVTVSANEGGSATVNGETGSALVWDGKKATLLATPEEGYQFAGWLQGTSVVSTENPYVFEVTEDVEFVANFKDENALEYCKVDGAMTNGGRQLKSLTITDGSGSLRLESIQPSTSSPVYVDRTAAVFETQAGSTIYFTEYDWVLQWMHSYAYIDYNKDGEFNTTVNANGTNSGELVSYNQYNNKDSHGNSANQQYANTNTYSGSVGLPSFVLPADLANGTYRMRIKVDWNNIDPCGASDIRQNGGCQLDFTIKIVPPTAERTITVVANPADGGVITGAGTAAGNITLTAQPNPGYIFGCWTLGTDTISTDLSITDSTEGDKEYTAHFIESYPIMSYIYTNGYSQANRYLKEVVATAGDYQTVVFSATTEEELPKEDPEATGVTAYNGAIVDKTATPIVIEEGTTEFSVNFKAWTSSMTIGGYNANSQLQWTQQAVYIDWNNNRYFLDEGENQGKSSNTIGNDGGVSQSFISEAGYTRSFSVPEGIQPGTYRMRVCYFEPNGDNSEAWDETLFSTYNSRTRNGKTYDFSITVVAMKNIVTVESADAQMGSAYIETEGVTTKEVSAENPEAVTITAVAAEGYEFANWTLNGTVVSTEAVYTTEVITENVTYVANFQFKPVAPRTVKVTSNNKQKGYAFYVSPQPEGTATDVTTGDIVIVQAIAQTAYDYFVNWTINGEEVGTSTIFKYDGAEDATIQANFMSKYPVEISANEGGSFTLKNGNETVASGTTLDEGTVLTITATPAYMKQMDALLINGVDVAADYNADGGYSFELAAATTIEVVFGDLTATLTYEVSGGGYIECWSDEEALATKYENGGDLPVNGDLYVFVYPQDDAELLSLTINGEDYMGEIEEYGSAYYVVDGNVNVVAEFTPVVKECQLVVSIAPTADYGTVSINGVEGTSVTVVEGTEVTVVATPAEGKVFEGWYTYMGEELSTDATYTFALTEDMPIQAWFADAPVVEPEYCTYEGNSQHSERRLNALTITDGTNTTTVSSIQPNFRGAVYVDKTDVEFPSYAGASVSFSDFDFKGEWMHAYIYVDYDNDGTFNTTVNADGTTGGELVSFTFYSATDAGTGVNSLGETVSNYTIPMVDYLPAFTLPSDLEDGDYRVRVKIDWCHLDPCGHPSESANKLTTNGGCIADFTMTISEANGVEFTEAEVAQVYAADGVIYINGYEGAVKVVNVAGQVIKDVNVNGNETLEVAAGLYIVVTGDQVTKVVVK